LRKQFRLQRLSAAAFQVLPSSVAVYERCRTQESVDTPSTRTRASEHVVVNGPRTTRLVDETTPAGQKSRSTTEASPNHVDSRSTADRQKEGVDVKPIISDVKVCPRHSAVSAAAARPGLRTARTWRSTESIDRLFASATQPADGGGSAAAAGSSFVDPATTGAATSEAVRRSVYVDLGEYQTLLKHGRADAVYSLPQSHCYGDDTLRAVKLITDKYDTFKRRQMRALSFRDATRQHSSADSHAIAEGRFCPRHAMLVRYYP